MSTTTSSELCAWFEGEVAGVLPDLYGAALRLARNHADAEDLVAEAVARAWAAVGTLSDRSSFRGWIFRILTNTFLSDRRARAARPVTQPLDEETGDEFSLFERLHQPFLLWWGNPEQAFLDRLLREDLERAVADLPEGYRMVVVLVELQGFSYQDVAEVLEIPIGTVRSRLARGRALLQKALWEHARDVGLVDGPVTPELPKVPR
ncbi:MAG: sigma-70 family RNA polymerase sigma factor [Gemmatimonadetes bacterium]|nr:sigma-70 family RNA polymerase sigma factor [Gemmatimonadota bacterium]